MKRKAIYLVFGAGGEQFCLDAATALAGKRCDDIGRVGFFKRTNNNDSVTDARLGSF